MKYGTVEGKNHVGNAKTKVTTRVIVVHPLRCGKKREEPTCEKCIGSMQTGGDGLDRLAEKQMAKIPNQYEHIQKVKAASKLF